MNILLISLLVLCIMLIMIYNTRIGRELKNKCNNTVGLIADSVIDLSNDPEKIYQETRGDFYDLKAKLALKKFLAIPEDKRTAMINYKIGNIYRYHVKNAELTHHYYQMALEQLRTKPSSGNIQMLDRMGDYEQHNIRIDHDIPEIRELIAEDLMVRQLETLGQEVTINYNAVDVHDMQNLRNIELLQPGIQRNRRKTAPKIPNIKILGDENKNKFFKNITTWTSDTQNVHDSHLTNDVDKSYQKIIVGLPKLIDASFEITNLKNELMTMSTNGTITKDIYENALKTINSMRPDSVYSKIGESESNILANIYRRINIPSNLNRRKDLIHSLAINLSNAVERNNVSNMPVCVSGRVASAISSLAYLDSDPDIGILKTKEAIRNEVFQTAYHEYKSILDESSKSADNVIKKGADDIQSGDDSPESRKLEDDIKLRIEARLKREFAKLIDETELNKLISEANMAF